jgi:hypothetical protein
MGGLLLFAVPLVALISGLFLAGDPHRRVSGRIVGVLLLLAAGVDSVVVARAGSGDCSEDGGICQDGDVVRLVFLLTAVLLVAGLALRGERRAQRG